jgi:hypothetical protein
VADSIEGLIYAEAQRGLALQPVLLNELRARTGILLALATATTSFLGGIAVKDGQLGCWEVRALIAFGVAVLCCLAVLSPRWKWTFFEDVSDMVDNYCENAPPEADQWTLPEVQRDLALHMKNHADAATKRMGIMQWLFVVAGIGLAVEIACWLIAFD